MEEELQNLREVVLQQEAALNLLRQQQQQQQQSTQWMSNKDVIQQFRQLRQLDDQHDVLAFIKSVEFLMALCQGNELLIQFGTNIVANEKVSGAAANFVRQLGMEPSWEQMKAKLMQQMRPKTTYEDVFDRCRFIKGISMHALETKYSNIKALDDPRAISQRYRKISNNTFNKQNNTNNNTVTTNNKPSQNNQSHNNNNNNNARQSLNGRSNPNHNAGTPQSDQAIQQSYNRPQPVQIQNSKPNHNNNYNNRNNGSRQTRMSHMSVDTQRNDYMAMEIGTLEENRAEEEEEINFLIPCLEKPEYNFHIEYIKGKNNNIADFLSRIREDEINIMEVESTDEEDNRSLGVQTVHSKEEDQGFDMPILETAVNRFKVQLIFAERKPEAIVQVFGKKRIYISKKDLEDNQAVNTLRREITTGKIGVFSHLSDHEFYQFQKILEKGYTSNPKFVFDNEFNSLNVKEFLEKEGIEYHSTKPNSHTGNSDVERLNNTLTEKIRTLNIEEKRPIIEQMAKTVYFYNNTYHTTTKSTPFEIQNHKVDHQKLYDRMSAQKTEKIKKLNENRETYIENRTEGFIRNYKILRHKEEPKFRKANLQNIHTTNIKRPTKFSDNNYNSHHVPVANAVDSNDQYNTNPG
ncbi:putative uncharacterized protein DDB_G0282499 [Anastrepha obliqua]|uniref:putative uncharacterized protein DDB_G0282499 n=1 Tax=Anastrepha obliqua TaxID=95512 RepID=UPI0024095A3F|nr:putative uncharacterized protein DDB_G0282499 [Anastrepha obliqua]